MIEELLLSSIGILLAGGALCYLLEGIGRKLAGPLAVLCTLAAVILAIPMIGSDAGLLTFGVFRLPLPLELSFRVTPFMSVINFFALLFGFCVTLYSLSYFAEHRKSNRFYAFALWAVAGASIALLAENLLLFVLAWELVTLMLYLLIGLGGPEARAGAFKAFTMLGFSDVAILLGIACLVARGGLPALSMMHLEGLGHVTVQTWGDIGIFLLLLTGALAKAGAFPLHTWIPVAAEHAPVPTMALLPASLDKLLGIVLLARISLSFFTLTAGLKILLMCIGAVTIIGAVMMAMVQHELKRLLSFHAVSQVGYMVLGVGTGVPVGVIGGIFHMVNHAIYKSLLFLAAGSVEHRTHELDLDRLGGLSKAMPLTGIAFFIGALSISGVPPLNGFVSKWFVYQGVISGGGQLMPFLLGAAVVGSALTLASFIKAMHSVFLGEESEALAGKKIKEAGATMLVPMGILAGLCVVLGLGAGAVVTNFLKPGVENLGLSWTSETARSMSISSVTGLWGPLPAMILMVVGLGLGLLIYALGKGFKVRRVRAWIGGEQETRAPTHLSGTQFYLTVRNLPVIKQIYDDAEKQAFDIYRLVGQYGHQIVDWISSLHTGVLPSYAAWCIAGIGGVLGLLFWLL